MNEEREIRPGIFESNNDDGFSFDQLRSEDWLALIGCILNSEGLQGVSITQEDLLKFYADKGRTLAIYEQGARFRIQYMETQTAHEWFAHICQEGKKRDH